MNPGARGFGWLPDVPSVKDYVPDSPDVATLMKKTTSARLLAGVSTTGSGAAEIGRAHV